MLLTQSWFSAFMHLWQLKCEAGKFKTVQKQYIWVLKKASAILFFAIYLLATTEARQLLKLPIIFNHFVEHRQQDRHITLLQFLAIHYTHSSPGDKDTDRDMQLPFKTCGNCVAVFANAFVPLSVQITIVQPIVIRQQQTYVYPDRFLISTYLSNIWQPPKYC